MNGISVSASSSAEGRFLAVMAEVDALAAELPRERLPDLFGGLERVRRVAELRLIGEKSGPQPNPGLLDVADVAGMLKITKQTVYRWAKTTLRFGVVDAGEGTLRFDPRKIQKFIESRRRS